MRTVVLKQMKDGRVCIHWLIRDQSGPIALVDCPIPTPYPNNGIRGRIACNNRQNKATPVDTGIETLLCCRSDDVRAVTCPACLATPEAKAMLEHYGEMVEPGLSEEQMRMVERVGGEVKEMLEKV